MFRSNLLTQDNGILTFSNLSPGQYYFKPMMKEFRFEPSSQMIEVQEGQNLRITITGYRTAYSCYGTVSSLNGEPEQGVAVEAVGQKDCSIYGEDTVTDEEGSSGSVACCQGVCTTFSSRQKATTTSSAHCPTIGSLRSGIMTSMT